MRIIGGRDYYDSAIVFGVDPKYVFERHSESNVVRDSVLAGLEYKPSHWMTIYFWRNNQKKAYLKYATNSGYSALKSRIYFCGKKYEFYKVCKFDGRFPTSELHYFYDKNLWKSFSSL